MQRNAKGNQGTNPAELPREQLAPIAKDEGRAIAAWYASGQEGPRPATPVSDFLAANPAASRASKKVGTNRGVLPADGVLSFHIGDVGAEQVNRMVAESQHGWAVMAGYTAGGAEGRLSVNEIYGRLRDAGITDPDHMPARIVLPCGGKVPGPRVIETHYIPGRVLPDGRVIDENGKPVEVKPAAEKPARKPRKPAAGSKPAAPAGSRPAKRAAGAAADTAKTEPAA